MLSEPHWRVDTALLVLGGQLAAPAFDGLGELSPLMGELVGHPYRRASVQLVWPEFLIKRYEADRVDPSYLRLLSSVGH